MIYSIYFLYSKQNHVYNTANNETTSLSASELKQIEGAGIMAENVLKNVFKYLSHFSIWKRHVILTDASVIHNSLIDKKVNVKMERKKKCRNEEIFNLAWMKNKYLRSEILLLFWLTEQNLIYFGRTRCHK